MMDSNPSSNNISPPYNESCEEHNKTKIKFAVLFLIFSIIGFCDSTFLAIKNLTGSYIGCGVNGGCDIVTSSVYSTLFGIPVALFGTLYYLSILLLVVFYLDKKKIKILLWISRITVVGFLASIYFVYLQLFVIHSICYFCMGSAITSTSLFVVGMVYLYRQNKQNI
ncbi:MAG: hypothetical protein COX81_03195 [Candidatus Magasanikbacteria bacterium CG_4_10_14_0_2_um_filter_37_12]|uniref:Vitamin K epoxide reductase domain-containing protein n=1 Tax=Candidatus Magasanikbacteria bacterium CG_4_10_14_0_2_um_filter_37_12 TaxID=1974637 RepID=A0A2M7V793_9BACT|nr:MAG: hypothetical protein COX81_03195 [Candidatus Magasanikbacteria bacterium CG_4_10_14_0_2_um_filter_37_12]